MDRLTNSTVRLKHLEQNLKKSDSRIFNNTDVSDSVAHDDTSLPTLRSITQSNEKIIFPSIQIQNHRNNSSIKRQYDDSSVVESTSYSGGEFIDGFKKSASEPTLNSRMSSKQENNVPAIFEVRSSSFFEKIPEEVIRKILVEPFIDLNDIPASAKNLMNFASTSKFNREFTRELLSEKRLKEDSFEITKSVIPNLLARLANDKKEKFTQSDIDYLVHSYPYLTVDCSYQKI